MNLSVHFDYDELTFSEVALRLGIGNKPPSEAILSLQDLCETLLEPIRSLLNVPLHINSGYRSSPVNLAVGGAQNSAHLSGCAADFVPIGFPLKDAFDAVRLSKLPYDQCIFECQRWIHIAIPPEGAIIRREALTATGAPGHWAYTRVV